MGDTQHLPLSTSAHFLSYSCRQSSEMVLLLSAVDRWRNKGTERSQTSWDVDTGTLTAGSRCSISRCTPHFSRCHQPSLGGRRPQEVNQRLECPGNALNVEPQDLQGLFLEGQTWRHGAGPEDPTESPSAPPAHCLVSWPQYPQD